MKMKITVEIENEDGTKTIEPVVVDTEIPDYDDFKGPDTFLQDFDVLEKAVLKIRNDAAKEAVEAYLEDISKKKLIPELEKKKSTK